MRFSAGKQKKQWVIAAADSRAAGLGKSLKISPMLAQILIITTNLLLQVTPFMMILSSFTLLFLTPGVVSIGIGLGALPVLGN